MSEPARPVPALAALQAVLLFLLLVAAGATWLQGARAKEAAEESLKEARAASTAAVAAERAAARAAEEAGALRADLDMLAGNVGAVEQNLRELAEEVKYGGLGGGGLGGGAPLGGDPGGLGAPPAQPRIEYTPELRESLRKAVAAKGVTLLEDRVVIPGKVILRQAALEYLAVFPRGKTHESIFLLTGRVDPEGGVPEGLGAALNSCLMALGLEPGTPIRFLPGGRVIPARGSKVYISVEWEEDGAPVRVRACDMLWDRERSRTLEEGKFIYVGSFFDPDGYVPDLAGDAVAVYSVPTSIVDLDDPRAANDTIFLACGPRIPPEGTKVDLVFSREPLTPTRTWDPEEPSRRTDPGAPPPGEEPAGTEGEEDDGGGK